MTRQINQVIRSSNQVDSYQVRYTLDSNGGLDALFLGQWIDLVESSL